jgi:hypothetical protein
LELHAKSIKGWAEDAVATQTAFFPKGLQMTPTPTLLGFYICEQVIVDQRSRNPSLISVYTGRGFLGFPTDRVPFSLFCSLTDGLGKGRIRLEVSRLLPDDVEPDQENVLYVRDEELVCPGRHAIVHSVFRIRDLSFPEEGVYQFPLSIDGEWIASRRLRVYLSGA